MTNDPDSGIGQTSMERLTEALEALPGDLPQYVAAEHLLDSLDALLATWERLNG